MATINNPDGVFANVTKTHLLETAAITLTAEKFSNIAASQVWSFSFRDVDPVGADDFFMTLENDGEFNYLITDFRLYCSTTVGRVDIHRITGSPIFTAPTIIDSVNRSTQSVASPKLIVTSDTDTTGITSGGILFHMNLSELDTDFNLRSSAGIDVTPNGKVALSWSAATGTISGQITVVQTIEL